MLWLQWMVVLTAVSRVKYDFHNHANLVSVVHNLPQRLTYAHISETIKGELVSYVVVVPLWTSTILLKCFHHWRNGWGLLVTHWQWCLLWRGHWWVRTWAMIIGVSRENRGLLYKFDCVAIYFGVVMVLYWTKVLFVLLRPGRFITSNTQDKYGHKMSCGIRRSNGMRLFLNHVRVDPCLLLGNPISTAP